MTVSLVNKEDFKQNLDGAHESDMTESWWFQFINPGSWPLNGRELEIIFSWFMESSG